MGFVAEVLGGEKGIQIYYIIGILIFIGLTIMIVFRTMRIPKSTINEYKTSILDKEELASNNI